MQLQILVLTSIMAEVAMKTHFRPLEWYGKSVPMVWIDGRNREYGTIDTFYDRIVSIAHLKPNATRRMSTESKVFNNEVTAVIITDLLLLTSFNAFRTLAQKKNTIGRLRLSIMLGRLFEDDGTLKTYFVRISGSRIVCGRQVIPTFKNMSVPSHMRHGRHSPVHDLMVLRVKNKIKFLKPIPKPTNSFSNYRQGRPDPLTKLPVLDFGPIQTELARPGDEIIVEDLKYASVGHLSDKHIKESRYLEKEDVYADDNVLTNCDEWMPREWGHFICIRNVYDYAGIASGGMLFSGSKLFGIGAFALWKGGIGILVFTDIRPYWYLLHRTCTVSDQNLSIPEE